MSEAKSGMPAVMVYVEQSRPGSCLKVVTRRFALGGQNPDVASLHPGYAR